MKQLTEEKLPFIKESFVLSPDRDLEQDRANIVRYEALGNRPPITRNATVCQIVGEGKDRIVILDYHGIYVYIFDNELPDKLRKMSNERLAKEKIWFKVIGIHNDKYIGSCNYVGEFYKTAMTHGKILKGKIRGIYPNKKTRGEYAVLQSKGDEVIIPSDEFSMPLCVLPQDRYGKIIEFVVTEVKPNGKVYGSSKIVTDYRSEQLDYFMDTGTSFKATVEKVTKAGAFLIFKHNNALVLRNKDFAKDFTTCKDILEPGDIVTVKIKKKTSSDRYLVEMIEKVKVDPQLDFKDVKVEDEFDGDVVTVEPFGCFVRIAPGRDVLCPVNEGAREPNVDDKVRIKIIVSSEEKQKMRGKIIKYIDDLPDMSKYPIFD